MSDIEVPVWWKSRNGGMLRRESLDPDHVGSTYSYVKNDLGLRPEDYGINAHGPYCITCERKEQHRNDDADS